MRESFTHDTRRTAVLRTPADLPVDPRESHPLVTPPAMPSELERQAAGLPELPEIDPVAFLGTARHPVSTPPTVQDVLPARAPSRSSVPRGALLLGGAALLVPFFLGITRTSNTDDAHPRSANPTTVAALEAIRLTPVVDDTRPSSSPDPEAPVARMSAEPDPTSTGPVDVELPSVRIGSSAATLPRAPRPSATSPSRVAFDFAAAMDAVANAAVGPLDCGPDALGTVTVAVTFAPSGEATHARVEDGPLHGTPAGSCVARRLRRAHVAPFEGGPAMVRTSLALR